MGFTGTRNGMTAAQAEAFVDELGTRMTVFNHGCCVGADKEAHDLVRKNKLKSVRIFGHPPENKSLMAECDCDVLLPPMPYLVRNKIIVDNVNRMIAAPAEMTEQERGGTWSTIRYALKRNVPCTVVLPDGTAKPAHEVCKV